MKVSLLMTTTLDGRIARDPLHIADWSEKADKELFKELTKEAGVLIMGSKTFDTIGRPLPGRKNIVMTRKSDRVSDSDDLVFSNDSPEKILKDLKEEGFTSVFITGGSQINTLFAKKELLDDLFVTISPLIFGTGISLFDETISMKLHLTDTKKIGEDSVLLHYSVIK